MQKIILTSIIILATLNAFATNCTRYLFDAHEKVGLSYGVLNGMYADSIFVQYRNPQHTEEFDITKYYWTVDQFDSAITYKKKHNSDEWEITVQRASDSADSNLDFTQEGNLFRFFYTGKTMNTEELIYQEKDSVNRVTNYIDAKTGNADFTYETISVIRNDTIYKSTDNGQHHYITYLDSTNENKCYMMTGENYQDIEAIYEFEMRGDTLVEIETIPGGYQSTYMVFFVPINKSSSIISRRSRPTIKRQDAKPFDLLGRPAKGKYTVKLMK